MSLPISYINSNSSNQQIDFFISPSEDLSISEIEWLIVQRVRSIAPDLREMIDIILDSINQKNGTMWRRMPDLDWKPECIYSAENKWGGSHLKEIFWHIVDELDTTFYARFLLCDHREFWHKDTERVLFVELPDDIEQLVYLGFPVGNTEFVNKVYKKEGRINKWHAIYKVPVKYQGDIDSRENRISRIKAPLSLESWESVAKSFRSLPTEFEYEILFDRAKLEEWHEKEKAIAEEQVYDYAHMEFAEDDKGEFIYFVPANSNISIFVSQDRGIEVYFPGIGSRDTADMIIHRMRKRKIVFTTVTVKEERVRVRREATK